VKLQPPPAPTPIVELTGLRGLPGGVDLPRGARLFAKLESGHPGGSIKDRPVARILREALGDGRIRGRRVLDSSSGNAGIAYAHIGARLGLDVTLVVPGNASAERLARIRAHGAELILTDPIEGYDFAVRHARELAGSAPDRYWYADQYGNDDNWLAHYHGTGGEIATQVHGQTGAPPDAFVAGIGSRVADILRVDSVRLLVETAVTDDAARAPVESRLGHVLGFVPEGWIDSFTGDPRGRKVVLRQVAPASAEVYGTAADWVGSEALLRLDFGPGKRPGLLVLGAEDPHQFRPNQGTDLLAFFAGVFERAMRRWLS